MVEKREKNQKANDTVNSSGRRQQANDFVQRRPRLSAEEETRRRNERAKELRLKNRQNRMR